MFVKYACKSFIPLTIITVFSNFAIEMKKIFAILLLMLAVSDLATASEPPQLQRGIETQVNIPKITIQQGAIGITNSSDMELTVDVYSITGQLVKRVRLSNGSITLEVKAGCYIVKCDSWSKKVIVS